MSVNDSLKILFYSFISLPFNHFFDVLGVLRHHSKEVRNREKVDWGRLSLYLLNTASTKRFPSQLNSHAADIVC